MNNRTAALVISGTTIIVFILTVLDSTRSIVNSLFSLYIVIPIIGFVYYPFFRKNTSDPNLISMYLYIIFVSILFWIGVTGWFISPFFYLLYLIALVLGFVFSPFVTLIFIAILLGLFFPNIGSIDLTLDLITIVSLLSVVPLTYYLREEYLKLQENEKKVLILEDKKKTATSNVEGVLLNKISKFSLSLREPIADIKQIAMVIEHGKYTKDKESELKKIVELANDSLEKIENFEEKITGKQLAHTRNGRHKH